MTGRAPLGVVGCGSLKAARPARARDLYRSGYFRLRLQCATVECERVLIVSAKYGLVTPATMLAPYELRITDLDREARAAFADRIQAELADEPGPIRLYMGADYRRLFGKLPTVVAYPGSIYEQMAAMAATSRGRRAEPRPIR